MKKTVIFDLDGTLIHSIPEITKYLNLTLKHFGYPLIDENRTLSIIGCGARNLVKNAINCPVSEEKFEEIFKFYDQEYTKSDNSLTVLFDGIEELLIELKRRGYLLAILTNKQQKTTEQIYQKLLSKFNFDAVLGDLKGVPMKPDKRSVERVFNALNVTALDCYMVGDMQTDYLAGVNSGCTPVCVLWGYGNKEHLSSLGCENFVNTPSELLEFLK